MKSRRRIYMDFKKAMDAAKKLRNIAKSMNDNADSMDRAIRSIDNSWDGENSEAYITKGLKIKGNISTTAEGILRTAEAIEEIAERTKEAELAAIDIADD